MLLRIVFFCLALLPFSAFAQTSWNLTNTSNQTLNFDTFDPARGSWKQQTIYPNQPVNYSVSPGTAGGKFRIATQNRGFVEYQVRVGARYSLGWDKDKGVWDLKLLAAAAPVAANAAPPTAAKSAALAAYELRNSSNEKLSFATLDQARGTWKTQTAFPNEVKSLTFSAGTQVGKIRIETQGRGYVEYDVRAGWKYNLLWDKSKGVWDFRTVQRAV